MTCSLVRGLGREVPDLGRVFYLLRREDGNREPIDPGKAGYCSDTPMAPNFGKRATKVSSVGRYEPSDMSLWVAVVIVSTRPSKPGILF